jgi:hypothetical protein
MYGLALPLTTIVLLELVACVCVYVARELGLLLLVTTRNTRSVYLDSKDIKPCCFLFNSTCRTTNFEVSAYHVGSGYLSDSISLHLASIWLAQAFACARVTELSILSGASAVATDLMYFPQEIPLLSAPLINGGSSTIYWVYEPDGGEECPN